MHSMIKIIKKPNKKGDLHISNLSSVLYNEYQNPFLSLSAKE